MGLSLSHLSLAAYRSYRSLRWEGDQKPIALYGDNGAGKTNILEAVSLLSPGRGMRRALPAELARREQGIGWRITGMIEAAGPHQIVTGAEGEASRTVQIDGKAVTQLALGKLVRLVWLTPAMDRLWMEGASERRRFLDRITLSFAADHAQASATYERAMRERNRLLKDNVQEAAWFDALEHKMAKAGEMLAHNRAHTLRRLTEAQNDAVSAFPRAALMLAGPDGMPEENWDAGMLCEALSRGRARDQAAGRTLTGPHRSDLTALYTDKGMPAQNCSTGEQKALLISLILASARAVAEDYGAPPLLLLDEVAAHLDADRRAALYDEICALGAQAWMTGTGPELFEALGRRAQHLKVIECDEGSRIIPG